MAAAVYRQVTLEYSYTIDRLIVFAAAFAVMFNLAISCYMRRALVLCGRDMSGLNHSMQQKLLSSREDE
jgi:hypothetical protein